MLNKLKKYNLSLFQPSSNLRKIVTNTGWLFADRILRMGVGLIVGVWVARYLGVQQFGIFNYATAFVALFSTLSTLGLDAIVVRSIVQEPDNKANILGTTFLLKLLGGLLSILLSVGFISVVRPDDKITINLVAILASVGIFKAFDTIDIWFQSQVKSKYSVIAKNTSFFIVTLLKIYMISINAPLINFAWITVAESFLEALCLIFVYKTEGWSINSWSFNISLGKNLLKESWPLILSGLTIMIYMKIDQIMLGQMINDKAVGIYSAAARISEVWYFIPLAIASSVSPGIYAAKKINEETYYKKIKNLTQILVVISISVAAPMTFLSTKIITTVFGNNYADAGEILSIHIWASVFVSMGIATGTWFIAEGFTHLAFQRNLIGAATNIGLNLFLIPAYSGTGAAIATVISYSIASFFSHAINVNTRKIFKIQVQSLLFFLK
jgi:PST family polysaccharide transporter